VRVLRVLAEIRDGIQDLAGSREANALAETMDLDFIKQQAESGVFKWSSCTKLIGSIVEIIQRVQAPKRDTETKDKWKQIDVYMLAATAEEQPRAFCKALEFLLDRVNAMRIDAANNRLRLIAPVIKDHGIDYERGKFQDKLKDGSLTLERTTVSRCVCLFAYPSSDNTCAAGVDPKRHADSGQHQGDQPRGSVGGQGGRVRGRALGGDAAAGGERPHDQGRRHPGDAPL
jgi:hypothetical protein